VKVNLGVASRIALVLGGAQLDVCGQSLHLTRAPPCTGRRAFNQLLASRLVSSITPSDDAEARPTLYTTDHHIRTSCRVGIDQMARRERVMRAAGQTSRDEDRAAVDWTTTRTYFRIHGFVILR